MSITSTQESLPWVSGSSYNTHDTSCPLRTVCPAHVERPLFCTYKLGSCPTWATTIRMGSVRSGLSVRSGQLSGKYCPKWTTVRRPPVRTSPSRSQPACPVHVPAFCSWFCLSVAHSKSQHDSEKKCFTDCWASFNLSV